MFKGNILEKQQANGMQKKPVRGHWSGSLSQKLRCKPETVGLNVNVEALAKPLYESHCKQEGAEVETRRKYRGEESQIVVKKSPTRSQEDQKNKQVFQRVQITYITGCGGTENKGKQQSLGERSKGAARVMACYKQPLTASSFLEPAIQGRRAQPCTSLETTPSSHV